MSKLALVAGTAALVLVLASCASVAPSGVATGIFNLRLADAFANQTRAMSEPRAALRLDSGERISTCGQYLQLGDASERLRSPDNRRALQAYVICDSVALLKDAHAVPVADLAYGDALATRLDFRSFRSSMYQRTGDDAFTLDALAGQPLLIEPHAATLDAPDWRLALELVAIADFDGNGQPDWLVWLTDRSKSGTYDAFKQLVIHDVGTAGALTVDPAE